MRRWSLNKGLVNVCFPQEASSEETDRSIKRLRLARGMAGLSLAAFAAAPRELWPLIPLIFLIVVFRCSALSKAAMTWILVMLGSLMLTPSFSGKGFALWGGILTVAAGSALGFYGSLEPHRLARWLVISGLPSCALAYAQWAVAVPVPPSWLSDLEKSLLPTRVMGLFGNPNPFAGFILFIQPLAWTVILSTSGLWQRRAWILVTIIQTIAMALTFSYGVWLVLLIEAIGFLLLSPGYRKLRSNLVLFSVAAVAVIIAGWSRIGGTAGYRWQIWRAALSLIGTQPWGTGPGGFGIFYPLIPHAVPADHAHNLFLQSFIDYGWLGGVIFVGIMIIVLQRCWRRGLTLWSRSLIIAFTGQLAWGMFDYPWAVSVMAVLFWMGERWMGGVE